MTAKDHPAYMPDAQGATGKAIAALAAHFNRKAGR